jgi:protein-tyrosine-phosphatase
LPDAVDRPFRVDSAGFIGPGRNTPPEGQLAAQELGIDLASHVSRLLTNEDAQAFSLVVVMDTDQQRLLSRATAASRAPNILVLGDLDPGPAAARAIADPYGQPVDVFRHVYARIERCTAELARAVVR